MCANIQYIYVETLKVHGHCTQLRGQSIDLVSFGGILKELLIGEVCFGVNYLAEEVTQEAAMPFS